MRFTVVLVSLIYQTGQHGVLSGIFNAGPYNLKLVRHEFCDDQGTAEGTGNLYMIKKSTHKTFLHGIGLVPFDYDDTIIQETNFSRLGSRGWGQNAYKLRANHYCSDFRDNYPSIFAHFYKGWGIENPSCPIKAGNYSVDMDADLPRLSKLPLLPYGTYRMSQALFHGNPPVRFVCNTFYVTCTERPR